MCRAHPDSAPRQNSISECRCRCRNPLLRSDAKPIASIQQNDSPLFRVVQSLNKLVQSQITHVERLVRQRLFTHSVTLSQLISMPFVTAHYTNQNLNTTRYSSIFEQSTVPTDRDLSEELRRTLHPLFLPALNVPVAHPRSRLRNRTATADRPPISRRTVQRRCQRQRNILRLLHLKLLNHALHQF